MMGLLNWFVAYYDFDNADLWHVKLGGWINDKKYKTAWGGFFWGGVFFITGCFVLFVPQVIIHPYFYYCVVRYRHKISVDEFGNFATGSFLISTIDQMEAWCKENEIKVMFYYKFDKCDMVRELLSFPSSRMIGFTKNADMIAFKLRW
jgi:hypothetical protein